MNNYELVSKLKFSRTCSNSTSLPPPHSWNKVRVKPPLAQIPPKHTHHMLKNSFS